jgi:Tol biopolymer transport system component
VLVASGVFTEQPTSISVLKPAGGKVISVWDFRRGFRTDLSVGAPDWLSGKQIVFLGWKRSTGIYRMALDGTRLRKLRGFSGGVRGLSASPDGRRLAFTHHVARRYTDELYLMNADGSRLRRLRSRCRLGATDWSPDSKRLLVVSAATMEGSSVSCALDYDVDVVPVSGGTAKHISPRSTFRRVRAKRLGSTLRDPSSHQTARASPSSSSVSTASEARIPS